MKNAALSALKAIMSPAQARPEFLQVAALCLREGANGPEVLLVSSLNTRRWILPKGWPMDNRTLAEAALEEAWEEAGVTGTVEPASLGTFSYDKLGKRGFAVPCRCEVFRVHVATLADVWPERDRRERRWVPLPEACESVAESELKALLGRL